LRDIAEHVMKAGLVPVVVIADVKNAPDTAKALLAGGLDIMEITLRTSAGLEAIKSVKNAYPDMYIGAGTVLTLEQARQAVANGAEFIVSPGFCEEIVKWCLDKGIAIFPGCVTPSELTKAYALGLNTVKFFPANIYGGCKGMKALHGPFPMLTFIPTGGINADNLSEYADKSFVHAIGGGWLADTKKIKEGNFTGITETVKQAVSILLGFELAHVGINERTPESANSTAQIFTDAFGFICKDGNNSVFAGSAIEVCKNPGKGLSGHIAIKTNNLERACYYLKKSGFEADWSSAKKNINGQIIAVYLKKEIGGFAVHLMQK